MEFKGLKYFSFGQQVGYATSAVAYLENLIKREENISWETIIQSCTTIKGIEEKFLNNLPSILKEILLKNKNLEASHQIIHLTPEHFPNLRHPHKQNIGMTVWETNKLPKEWPSLLNNMDKIIVPCSWNVEVFKEAGIQPPVYRLPHISQFKGSIVEEEISQIPKDCFVFLNVSVWESRKNLEGLIKAYLKAFSGRKDVLLVLKTSKRDESGPFFKFKNYQTHIKSKNRLRLLQLKYGCFTPKILIISEEVSNKFMQTLYSRANAYVSLAHSEGWGMGLYESAWYGKPVLATNYSGYLDFLNKDNSYLIDYKMIPVKKNEWDTKNLSEHEWADPNIDHSIDLMRDIYNDQPQAIEKGRRLKKFVESKFSPEIITDNLLTIINS